MSQPESVASATRRSDSELDDFLSERNKALVNLDLDYARTRLPGLEKKDDGFVLMVLHKARYECTAIPAELRHDSRAWLDIRGLRRMSGDPLLPEGELPE